eukprot:PhM_4_TR2054/c3_g3_i11/m.10117
MDTFAAHLAAAATATRSSPASSTNNNYIQNHSNNNVGSSPTHPQQQQQQQLPSFGSSHSLTGIPSSSTGTSSSGSFLPISTNPGLITLGQQQTVIPQPVPRNPALHQPQPQQQQQQSYRHQPVMNFPSLQQQQNEGVVFSTPNTTPSRVSGVAPLSVMTPSGNNIQPQSLTALFMQHQNSPQVNNTSANGAGSRASNATPPRGMTPPQQQQPFFPVTRMHQQQQQQQQQGGGGSPFMDYHMQRMTPPVTPPQNRRVATNGTLLPATMEPLQFTRLPDLSNMHNNSKAAAMNGDEDQQQQQQPYHVTRAMNAAAVAAAGMQYDVLGLVREESGCRYLQDLLGVCDSAAVDYIVHQILTAHAVADIMSSKFGNYFIQKLLDVLDEEQLVAVIHELAPSIVSLSLNPRGTYGIRRLVDVIRTPLQADLITRCVLSSPIPMACDTNGSQVCRRLMKKFASLPDSAALLEPMLGMVANNIVQLSRDQQGCCVVQRCFDASTPEQKERLSAAVVGAMDTLVLDQYGNYVVQHVLDMGIMDVNVRVTTALLSNNVTTLARNKFSSNVIEKCLMQAPQDVADLIIMDLCHISVLPNLLCDEYGNYVVQRAMRMASGIAAQMLENSIRPLLPSIPAEHVRRKIDTKLKEMKKGAACGTNAHNLTPMQNNNNMSPAATPSNNNNNMHPHRLVVAASPDAHHHSPHGSLSSVQSTPSSIVGPSPGESVSSTATAATHTQQQQLQQHPRIYACSEVALLSLRDLPPELSSMGAVMK